MRSICKKISLLELYKRKGNCDSDGKIYQDVTIDKLIYLLLDRLNKPTQTYDLDVAFQILNKKYGLYTQRGHKLNF